MIVAVLLITACVQPVSEVDSFTLSGWTMKDYYDIDDPDALWTGGVTLNVVYRDGASESLDLDSSVNDGTVTLTGDYVEDPLGLETAEKGYFSVTITIDNVSLSFSYYVFDLDLARFVGASETYQTITGALAGAADGTTIFVEDGIYTETIDIRGLSDITVFGESEEGVVIDSSGLAPRALFATAAPNLALINLTFQDDYSEGGDSSKRFMVKLQTGTDNVTVRNVTINGPGKEFVNSADEDNPVGGLDLNTIDGALIENVHVTNISRNAMAFTSVTNLRILDMELADTGKTASGWASLALYGLTTLVELTGYIENANIGINYSVPPFGGFEYGSVVIDSTAYPLFLPYDEGILEDAQDFANNVTGTSWQVLFPFDAENSGLVYYATEAEANAFADTIPDNLATVENTAE